MTRPTTCPLCESESIVTFRPNCLDRLHDTPGRWTTWRCRNCGVVFTEHHASGAELLAMYPPEYSVSGVDRPMRGRRIGRVVRALAILPYTLRYGSPDRLPWAFGNRRALDVGCGTGEGLRQLMAKGWQASGVDFNPSVADAARSRAPGATVYNGTLDDVPADRPFALISLNHVLEHVAQPRAVITACTRLLAPGGRLLLSIPNIDSVEARMFGDRWRGLDIPRHLFHFNPQAIARLLAVAGLQVIRMRPALFASSISESLILSLPRPLRRRVLSARRLRLALYYAAVIPACLSYLAGNHAVLEIEATRVPAG